MATIVVIDDSKFSRIVAVKALKAGQHQIYEAEDGEKGLVAVEEHKPDCVICDLLMPNLDGIGFLRRLRGSGSQLPVIVVSADIQASSRATCEELGISDFLNKPCQPADLVASVERAVPTKQAV